MLNPLFDALVGTFAGTDKIHASVWGPAEMAPVDIDAAWEIGGGVLVQRWRDTRAADDFELVNIFMEDPATGEVLLYVFDTFGYPPDPPARGSWNGDRLLLERTTERGQGQSEFTPTQLGFRWSKRYRPSHSGSWQAVIDGELARVARESS